MKTKGSLLGFIFCILTISLLTSGGCSIEFSNDDDNGGGGGRTQSILRGTITDITPDRNLSGIVARIEQDDQTIFDSMPTGENGFFQITGDFSGSSLRLEFLDESENTLGARNISVFPDSEVRLGDISITNGTVDFDEGDGITVIFEGEITDNNCSGNTGNIEITADDNETEVIVQVDSSTNIIEEDGDDSPLTCEDLSGRVEVTGELLAGDSVDASLIQLQ